MSNKFNAKKTIFNGITFDSKKEASYYKQLLLLKMQAENLINSIFHILIPEFITSK